MLTGNDLLKAVQNLPSMVEQQELLKELMKCWEIAQQLDGLNPELAGSFTGTPSERIGRQLYTLGILTTDIPYEESNDPQSNEFRKRCNKDKYIKSLSREQMNKILSNLTVEEISILLKK